VTGLAVGIVVDGELAYAKTFGVRDIASGQPIDADTVFRIASITKSFTALAVLKLRDGGRLVLDAPAATYLPEMSTFVGLTRDAPPITVRMLLMHASGIAFDDYCRHIRAPGQVLPWAYWLLGTGPATSGRAEDRGGCPCGARRGRCESRTEPRGAPPASATGDLHHELLGSLHQALQTAHELERRLDLRPPDRDALDVDPEGDAVIPRVVPDLGEDPLA
jgi:hypothetical protein